jgi:hypothetical protein
MPMNRAFSGFLYCELRDVQHFLEEIIISTFATIAEVKPSIVIRVPAGMKVLTCEYAQRTAT